ncbi:MAG: methyltransferase domain-containing protein, partial [Alphaproteobacteria bacterium]|nr:methyltransferase domain-containing protein [Alphaproteobacteria bacterium]
MHPLENIVQQVPANAKVLDYGCFGWKVIQYCPSRNDIEHHGCDINPPVHIPPKAKFHRVDPKHRVIPVEDDVFDLVVASHVLEHVLDPLDLFRELVRVCKPGGRIYMETPSDRSLRVRSHRRADSHAFFSFWDDPTHLRPWPPAALYRLAISYGCLPLTWRYITTRKDRWLFPFRYCYYMATRNPYKLAEIIKPAIGWECFLLAEKPNDMHGAPRYCYAYLRNIPAGAENA